MISQTETTDARHPGEDDTGTGCGEKTYVGSGRLKDRKALVTGAIPESVALPPLLTRVKGLSGDQLSSRRRTRRSGCEKDHEECGRKAVLLPGDLSDEKFAVRWFTKRTRR